MCKELNEPPSYIMQVAEAVRDAVIGSAYICGSPLSMQFIDHDPVDLAAVIARVLMPTDDAAARIAELESKLVECRAKTIEDVIAEMDERGWFSKDGTWAETIRALGEKK